MNKLVIMIFLSLSSSFCFSQKQEDVFKVKEIVWFGLDFSKIKFVGGLTELSTSLDKYFAGWNDLIINKADEFKLKEILGNKKIKYDLSVVNNNNTKVDKTKIISSDKQQLTETELQNVINLYEGNIKEGIGLVFLMENFIKLNNTELCTMYAVFFDISCRKILLTESLIGKPEGFGMKSYWAKAIKEAMNKLETRYNKLKKNNSKKIVINNK